MKGGRSYSNHYQSSAQPQPQPQQMETHLPGSYIRVEEITTSFTPPSKPHKKKQIRRRLHTTRPYQERPLNMAEARKEIVTALKFHRASMKQQQQQHQQEAELPTPPPSALPPQTLGLNLSFHEFTHLDFATLYRSNPVGVVPFSPSSTSSPLDAAAASSDSGCSAPDQVGVGAAPPSLLGEMHDELEWINHSFLLEEDQFEQDLPLFSNSSNTSTATNLGLPCMKLEQFDGLDEEWLTSVSTLPDAEFMDVRFDRENY